MASYDVWTDLLPDELSEVGWKVMQKWIAFALGQTELNSHRVQHPSGRMARAIRMEKSPTHIAIILDESQAPEAGWLERGHGPVDLKLKLTPGRSYPMHRGGGVAGATSVWLARRSSFTGFARVPSVITPENAQSWIIPAMTAWEPARYLKDLILNGEFGDIHGSA